MRQPSCNLLLALALVLTACDPDPSDTGAQDTGPDAVTDADNDGFSTPQDCDDENAAVHPDAPETCGNGLDDNCDGAVDDDGVGSSVFWEDLDGDGHGGGSTSVTACTAPDGFVSSNDDCDDTRDDVHPGAADDTCDQVDQDCDGENDEDAEYFDIYRDADGDSSGNADLSRQDCAEIDGWVRSSDDCNDDQASIHPGAVELCDGVDQDCDRVDDNGVQGSGPECAVATCAELHDLRSDALSGDYWLLDDGDAFEARCELYEHGGDWTVIDLETIRERDWMYGNLSGGRADDWLVAWHASTRFLQLVPARSSRIEGLEGCNTAVVRATVEVPFSFTEWRSDGVDVTYYGDDSFKPAPGFGAYDESEDCTKGAFLVGTGSWLVKDGGQWGERVSDHGDQTLTWETTTLPSPAYAFFLEVNGRSSSTIGSSLHPHDEAAYITDAEIWFR